MLYEKINRIIVLVFLSVFAIIILFPFYIILVMSSYTSNELFRGVYYIFGDNFLENAKYVLTGAGFFRSYFNSIFVSSVSVIGGTFVSMMYGYGVSKYQFKMKEAFTWFTLVLLMIPGQVSIVGYVMQMRSWHLTSTLWPLILSSIASPFAAFFMIQYCKESIPNEVLESSRIDGAGEIMIFFRIAMPFMMPAFAAIGILLFLWSWNNYMLPLVISDTESLRTLPLYIRNLTSEYRDDPAAKCMGVVLTTIPLVVIYSIFSKAFISGIATGAVKG